MPTQIFSNNRAGVVNTGIDDIATSLVLNDASDFPEPSGGDWFLLTLFAFNDNGLENTWEIVQCTSRASNTLTIVRGQEGTVAVAWSAASKCEMRPTAGTLSAKTDIADKDATGGYAGLTLFKLNLEYQWQRRHGNHQRQSHRPRYQHRQRSSIGVIHLCAAQHGSVRCRRCQAR